MIVGSDSSRLRCFKPVDEDRRHARAFLRLAGLLLDDRGENDELLGRPHRQVGHAPLPDLLQHPLLLALHALDHLLARRSAREAVAFRQQRALARNVLDIAGEDLALQETAHDLLRGQSLGKRDGVLNDLAFHHGLDHVADARAFRLNTYSPDLRSRARLERDRRRRGRSIGARRSRLPAAAGRQYPRMPRRDGMFTAFSRSSGPGASKRCLANRKRQHRLR